LLFCVIVAGCRTTIDNLGYDDVQEAGRRELLKLSGPSTYQNAFRDVLGKPDGEIANKIHSAFDTLFHGTPADQAIFFPMGAGKAAIKDIFHNEEIRTEGMGLGMMICVEYDKQTEFDQLWRYAKENLIVKSGPARGYFNSYCDMSVGRDAESRPCLDPFGLQQFAMALVLAHGRWGSNYQDAGPATIDYNADAWMLLDIMRNKERENGGIIDGITNTFDSRTFLVFDEPKVTAFNYTRPAVEMPAYYDLWAQATGDTFWSAAAINARGFWQSVANQDTGLLPVKAYFSGNEFSGWNLFAPEGYRTQLNLALDQIWTGTNSESWHQTEANRIIDFFASILDAGNENYGMMYELNGAEIDATPPDASLVSVNGDCALIATSPNRQAFIQAVWDLGVPSGDTRYYAGLLYLLSLLMLSGDFRVY
jgi:oligosaccharide reducing-end xylanase